MYKLILYIFRIQYASTIYTEIYVSIEPNCLYTELLVKFFVVYQIFLDYTEYQIVC